MRGVRAWLVTWEWSGEHAKRDEEVAAVFDPPMSAERIRGYVELLYGERRSGKNGKSQPADLGSKIRPHVVFDSIADLPKWWD